jgi:hypothetical protein
MHKEKQMPTWLTAALTLTGTVSAGICLGSLRDMADSILTALSKTAGPEQLTRLLAATALLLLMSGAYCLHLKKQIAKPMAERYGFNDESGFPTDRKGRWICPKCLGDERIVRVVKASETAAWCSYCNKAIRGRLDR